MSVSVQFPKATTVATTGENPVEFRGAGFRRGDRWLFRGLDWSVPPGSFVAVAGPSGAGKSSLLGCLAGMLPLTEGNILYSRNRRPGEMGDRVGCIFQNLRLVRNSSALTNALCGRLGRLSWWRTLLYFQREERQQARDILVDFGLVECMHKWVCRLSGGEQQRVAVARALFQDPEIYLADEPVSNLDGYLAGRVLGRLRLEANNRSRTIFCVLHTPDLVDRFADFVLSLDPTRPGAWHVRTVEQS